MKEMHLAHPDGSPMTIEEKVEHLDSLLKKGGSESEKIKEAMANDGVDLGGGLIAISGQNDVAEQLLMDSLIAAAMMMPFAGMMETEDELPEKCVKCDDVGCFKHPNFTDPLKEDGE